MAPIQVAAAVIRDRLGRVLLSQRPEGVHQGGLWEFPGGKLEPGESAAQALRREIREELGVRVDTHRPLIRITHHYPDKAVTLDVHQVTGFTGAPRGLEGQPLAWVAPDGIGQYAMPAADRPIVAAIRLPDRYLVTGTDPGRPSEFLARLEAALARGVRLVQLRAPGLPQDDYLQLAERSLVLCRRAMAGLLLNAPPEWVEWIGADGVHLNARRLGQLEERPLSLDKWVGASCHNQRELAQAGRLGVDFAVLSPVLPTRSHPQTQPLGWDGFQALAEAVQFPLFALGGLNGTMREIAWANGGQGIAAIGGLWPE